ncbi:hypothetical protein EIY72_23870 [Pseudomonas vancouverensis]|uniref:Uncharacterized protein n=1 Tax=Pseudomonas vancouverensis TaxID=95300 RepID=A0A4R4JTM4_PSEVA|nr:hypothetical protein F7R09_22665 [Pseudomonas vancouverensis]TDB58014.1 hypothetical protein EIY72_23870 [Pseudomonas vancouverensis]
MGASLLAIAVHQSAEMLNVRPSSRASSLPQLFRGVANGCFRPRQIDPIDKRLSCIRAFCARL